MIAFLRIAFTFVAKGPYYSTLQPMGSEITSAQICKPSVIKAKDIAEHDCGQTHSSFSQNCKEIKTYVSVLITSEVGLCLSPSVCRVQIIKYVSSLGKGQWVT